MALTSLSQYSDYELTHDFFNASKDEACAEAGPHEDFERGSLSGKLQPGTDAAWLGLPHTRWPRGRGRGMRGRAQREDLG